MPQLRLIILAILVLLAQPVVRAQAESPVPLTRVADLCVVPAEEIAGLKPFRVRGVVTTWPDGARKTAVFTIHDGTAGIFVKAGLPGNEGEWRGAPSVLETIRVGSEIELEGVLERGSFKPNIIAIDLKLLGQTELPAPKQISVGRLLSGAAVTERVEVGGVVQSATPYMEDGWLWRIDTHAGYFMARLRHFPIDPRALVDAEVRVRGLVGSGSNGRSESLRPLILVERKEDLDIVFPTKSDGPGVHPAPKIPLSKIDGFSMTGRSLHRRRTEGTVSYCEKGDFCYLQEGTRGIRVGLASEDPLQPGDRVEVAGFLDISGQVAGLRGALVRKIEGGEAIKPVPTSLAAIRRSFEPVTRGMPSNPHDFDGLLVEVTGRLLSIQRLTGQGKARLLLGGEDELISADLAASDFDRLPELRVGSLLKITGVAVVEYGATRQVQELSQPMGLNLLLRGVEDVVVIDAASWWTPQRLGVAASVLGFVLVAVLVWTITLQRLLVKRTARLEDVMQVHRDQELEFRGARHERQRVAADMHDGVQQLIAGAAFRLEAAATHLTEMPPIVNTQFTAARRALLKAQDGLRDCLTGMLHIDEGPTEFPALLKHAAAAMEHWPEDLVEVLVEGERPYRLSRHVKGSLLLLMQEAVGNALKHGGARHVSITLAYQDDFFEMTLEDDGCGFDPKSAPGQAGGHFGLESMSHRMSWLGGTVEVLASPGEGVRVRTSLQRERAESPPPEDLQETEGGGDLS
jgi:signal transduction histidine kinase